MKILGLFTFLISAIATWLVTPIVIWGARKIGAVDNPGPRKIHELPMPRIGGVAVLAGCTAGLLFAGQATGYMFRVGQNTGYWAVVGVAALVMFGLGVTDDIRGLSFKTKFTVQFLAAAVVWYGGFRIEVLSHPFGSTPLDLGAWSLPLTILWIVGITNAINLIDGLDGLAAGVALIIFSAVAVISLLRDYYSVAAMSSALVGALAGFLVFNFNPARIFLGDSGSMFLGFMLAVMSIRSSQKATTAIAVLVPVLILGLPILDTTLAIARRVFRVGYRGIVRERRLSFVVQNAHQVFLPDRGHVHHRLLDAGLSHRASVLVLYFVVVVFALAALATVVMNSVFIAGVLVGVLSVLSAGFVVLVLVQRRRRSRSSAPGGGKRRAVGLAELEGARRVGQR